MKKLYFEYEKEEFLLEELIQDILENSKLRLDEENKMVALLGEKKICLGLRNEKILKEIKWIYINKFNKDIVILTPYNEKINIKIKINQKIIIQIIVISKDFELRDIEIFKKEINKYRKGCR